jgi:hypothetical protein
MATLCEGEMASMGMAKDLTNYLDKHLDRLQNLVIALAILAPLLTAPIVVRAHVKWFTEFSFADAPTPLNEAITPTFLALSALTFVVLGVLVFIDRRLNTVPLYTRILNWFEARAEYAPVVMRVGLGVTFLLSWQADTLLAPDLKLTPADAWIGWAQFALALLLVLPQTTPIAGAGAIALYFLAVARFGAFYMLDYFVFLGVGYYLIVTSVQNVVVRATRTPGLYFAVGLSLCWLALEKLIYPQWGTYLLQQNPTLTLGLDPRFFLTSAAFVEFALGYLLIICLLERPISLAITLVFFTTTLVFGKVEVIGHTIIHAALVVFLLEGPGKVFRAPIDLHRRLGWRVAFASVNFVLFLGILLAAYAFVAQREYEAARAGYFETIRAWLPN